MLVCPTILFYPCLHRNDRWWIPGNWRPHCCPCSYISSPQLDSWRLIKSLWRLLTIFFMSLSASVVRCFIFAEMTVWVRFSYSKYPNDLWYENTYIYRVPQPTAFNWFIYPLNSALFRYKRFIVCPKTRACQGRDHNFKWEWNVQRPHRNSPQNVSALQWWTFALRSRYGQLRHGMDIAVTFCSNANSEYTSCIQSYTNIKKT